MLEAASSMADSGEKQISKSEEDIKQRHKKEKKALQAEITKIKHGIPKSDKKTWKEAKEKIANLETELKARHEKELAECTSPTSDDVSASVAELHISQADSCNPDEVNEKPVTEIKQKKSKAQKRREKKVAESQAREERINEQEIENLTSSRHLEAVNIKATLAKRGLQIFEIPSDGNCLYAAVCHQLDQRKGTGSIDSLRKQVASYMRENQDNFTPFLTKDNGDCFTLDDFENYCVQLETTPAWGGQLEIQALSSILKVPIEVIQAEGPPLVTGEEHSQAPLILTYYRHAFGLGEHYHSVQILKTEDPDDFT